MSVRDRNMRLTQLRNAGVKVNDASTNKFVPFYPSSARAYASEAPASTSSGVPASSRVVSASDVLEPSSVLERAVSLSEANSAFNAGEAQKNRDWQERLANTAHQREVADLIAAGLNPVLSVTGGAGAATPSGSTASADNSGVSALTSVLNSVLSTNATLAAAQLASSATMYGADMKYKASRYSTNMRSLFSALSSAARFIP
jgi:hypothetical protein